MSKEDISMNMVIGKSQVTFENAEIGFKNFEGREGKYNDKGVRSFSIFLSEEQAKALTDEGWNVKWPKDREDEGDPDEDNRRPHLPVSVGFEYFPAKIYQVTPLGDEKTNVTPLYENEAGMLDWAELLNVDLVIRPYNWSVGGKSGIKAYLKSGYFTIIVDELRKKYGV